MQKSFTFAGARSIKIFESDGTTSSTLSGDVMISVDDDTFRIINRNDGKEEELAKGNLGNLYTVWINGREADFGQEKLEGYIALRAEGVKSFSVKLHDNEDPSEVLSRACDCGHLLADHDHDDGDGRINCCGAIEKNDCRCARERPSFEKEKTTTVIVKKDGLYYDIACGAETRSFSIFDVEWLRVNNVDIYLTDRYYFRYF